MQLEILNTRYNIAARFIFPIAMTCALYTSIMTAVGILRVDWSLLPHIPPTFGYFVMTGIFFGATFVGYSNYRIGETLRSDSEESLCTLQLRVEAAVAKELKGLGPTCRA